MTTADTQQAPHSLEAEVGVLGAMLASSYACGQVAAFLAADDFYHRPHRAVYEAIAGVLDLGQPVDLVTVVEQLRRHQALDQAGGPAALAQLAGQATPSHARAYAGLVKQKALDRKLIVFGQAVSQAGMSGTATGELADLQAELARLAAYNQDTDAVEHVSEALDASLDRIREIEAAGGQLLGVPTGLDDVDARLRGLQGGKLYTVAARPGMGKTTVAQSWIGSALDGGHRTLFFSMEMDRHELMVRMLAATARVDKSRMDAGTLDAYDHQRLAEADGKIRGLPLYIDDRSGQTLSSIRASAERTAMTAGGLDLVVVDYLGLIEGEGRRGDNRQNEVATISRGLKVLARDLDVPVVMLAQLSRKPEERPDKRPILADLRDSGAIEQDSDVVVFLYRDEEYDEHSPDKGLIELNIAKHRGGEKGLVKAAFLPHVFRVANLAKGSLASAV